MIVADALELYDSICPPINLLWPRAPPGQIWCVMITACGIRFLVAFSRGYVYFYLRLVYIKPLCFISLLISLNQKRDSNEIDICPR